MIICVKTLKNNNIVEIKSSNGTVITSKTINGGKSNEKKIFSISGRVQLNKPTVVATLKLTAAENKRFNKSPRLKKQLSKKGLGSNLKMNLNKVEKDDDGNTTNYLYDLVYSGKEKISKLNKLKYTLKNEAVKIITKKLGISRFEIGNTRVSTRGENKLITIHGTPKSTFSLVVLKHVPKKDSSGKYVIIQDSEASSIIPTELVNLERGVVSGKYNSLRGVIPSSGIYKYIQKNPIKKIFS